MFSVEFDQASLTRFQAAFVEVVRRRIQGACETAANTLAASYREELLATEAPPHSEPGQIPHRYDGYKTGGYGDPNADFGGESDGMDFDDLSEIFNIEFDPAAMRSNNRGFGDRVKNNTAPRFAKTQGDDEFLATFITYGSTETGGTVGFTSEGSHVAVREQNYLIHWDQGTVREFPGVERPWVDEIYAMAKPQMIEAFQAFLAGGSMSTVPF